MKPYHATALLRAGHWEGAAIDHVALDYEGRFVRRKRLMTVEGASVMVDLPQTVSLEEGDALDCGGVLIGVRAASEPLLAIRGELVRLAWHIGNRHTPCQVAGDHLLIRDDPVLAEMLRVLGAEVVRVSAPFRPEGGAYGMGRTHGHAHGPQEAAHGHGHDGAHDHDHDHDHDHSDGHDHGHDHGHGHAH